MPPLLSEMFFDQETCPGLSLVCSSGLPRVDPFFGLVWIIALSHIDSESNLLNLTFLVYTVTQYTTVSVRHQQKSYEIHLGPSRNTTSKAAVVTIHRVQIYTIEEAETTENLDISKNGVHIMIAGGFFMLPKVCFSIIASLLRSPDRSSKPI